MFEKPRSWAVALWLSIMACAGHASASPGDPPQPAQLQTPIPYLASNGRYGYVAGDGHMAIQPIYEDATPFSEGRAAVRAEGRWGFIDADGRWIVRPRFTRVWPYRDGEARADIVVASTKRGFIDFNPFHHDGKIIHYVLDRQGQTRDSWRDGAPGEVRPKQKPVQSAVADARAALAPACGCDFVDWFGFVDGYAAVARTGQGLGVIDAHGTLVVGFGDYDDLRYPRQGFFVGHGKHGWGILDATRNREVVPFERPRLDQVKILGEGSTQIALAVQRDNLEWDVLDPAGKILRGGFRAVWGAHEDIIAVQDGSGLWGALSSAGDWIFPPRYPSSFTFEHGLARVDSGALPFYIDRQGREFRDTTAEPSPPPR